MCDLSDRLELDALVKLWFNFQTIHSCSDANSDKQDFRGATIIFLSKTPNWIKSQHIISQKISAMQRV